MLEALHAIESPPAVVVVRYRRNGRARHGAPD